MLFDPKWEAPTEIKLEPWQKILFKAADIIEEKGWTQGMLKNKRGFCVIGAIRSATHGNVSSPNEFVKRLKGLHVGGGDDSGYMQALLELRNFLGVDTIEWNDFTSRSASEDNGRQSQCISNHARDKAHVIETLRKVAHAV